MNKEQFRANRGALGLTKIQLADELCISTRHIDYIEKGDRKPSGVLIRCFELFIEKRQTTKQTLEFDIKYLE